MSDGDERLSRRRLLQTSAITTATAAIAGCSGLLPGGGGGGGGESGGEGTTEEAETTTTTESGLSGTSAAAARVIDFVAEPDEISSRNHLSTTRIDPTAVEDSDELESGTQSTWKATAGVGINSVDDISLEDFERVAGFSVGSVAIGKVAREDVVGALEDQDLNEDSTYNGFTIYEGDIDFSQTYIAVSNTTSGNLSLDERTIVVSASDQNYYADDPNDVIETLIDAGNGSGSRYDENEDYAKLATASQGADYQNFATQDEPSYADPSSGTFENAVGRATTYTKVGESDADFAEYILFEDEGDVDTGDVDDYIEDYLEASNYYDNRDFDDLTSSQDGRMVTVSGTVETDTL